MPRKDRPRMAFRLATGTGMVKKIPGWEFTGNRNRPGTGIKPGREQEWNQERKFHRDREFPILRNTTDTTILIVHKKSFDRCCCYCVLSLWRKMWWDVVGWDLIIYKWVSFLNIIKSSKLWYWEPKTSSNRFSVPKKLEKESKTYWRRFSRREN